MGWGKIYEADLGLTHITNSDQNMILWGGGDFARASWPIVDYKSNERIDTKEKLDVK